jgi:uncharacterized protein YndB with AHSA1/START domain
MHSVAGNREPGRLCTLASAEWCCPSVEVNPVAEGKCNYRPDAGDGSTGFDSGGEYTGIVPNKSIHYRLEADREMEFTASGNGAKVVETFGAENENSAEQRRQGWPGIPDNFNTRIESLYH